MVFKVAVHVHLHGYTPVVTSRLQASVDIGKEFLSPRVSKSKESQVKFLFLLQPSLDTSMAPGSLTLCVVIQASSLALKPTEELSVAHFFLFSFSQRSVVSQ